MPSDIKTLVDEYRQAEHIALQAAAQWRAVVVGLLLHQEVNYYGISTNIMDTVDDYIVSLELKDEVVSVTLTTKSLDVS